MCRQVTANQHLSNAVAPSQAGCREGSSKCPLGCHLDVITGDEKAEETEQDEEYSLHHRMYPVRLIQVWTVNLPGSRE